MRPKPFFYLLPGISCFIAFMILPLIYTVNVAFTNLGTGHLLSLKQVKTLLLQETYIPEDGKTFNLQAASNKSGLQLFLTDTENPDNIYKAVVPTNLNKNKKTILKLQKIDAIEQLITEGQLTKIGRGKLFRMRTKLKKLKLELENKKFLTLQGGSKFAESHQRYIEDQDNILIDTQSNKIYKANHTTGYYINGEERLTPGFTTFIGFKNFTRLISDPNIVTPFAKIFLWTIVWAALSVFLSFSLGMFLALFLNKKKFRFRFIYRMLLIIPYSIPFFISVFIFRGMMNKDFGVINEILFSLTGMKIPWLTHPFWAKASCLVVNLWLGFPYMLLLITGILQSIPGEIYEAVILEGANKWTTFKKITLPMVMSAIGPLLVGTFAFNFNNFVGIYLLTGGLPAMENTTSPAGETDILLSYTFRLAFEGGQGQDFGLASSIAIVIFIIISILTIINFKYTGVLKKS